ncbi:MAG: arylesterase [Desulfococcaceae bacterium]|jgi:acyl-CoA thioesterase-1|nr:arylesterase [Desulfococcaceae bacterium]
MRLIFFCIYVSAVLGILTGCEKKSEEIRDVPSPQKYEGIIAAVGDSLTEGYGVEEEEAWPALLEKKLHDKGFPFQVINAGISGETSSGTLSRISWIMNLNPDIVILETGANDGLRGIEPSLTRKNIDESVRLLQQKGVTVVLAGMKMVRNLGSEYTQEFAGIYPAVAGKYGIPLIPFFLEGVAGEPALNQADGIHPTAEGYKIISETVCDYALKAIRIHKNKTGPK